MFRWFKRKKHQKQQSCLKLQSKPKDRVISWHVTSPTMALTVQNQNKYALIPSFCNSYDLTLFKAKTHMVFKYFNNGSVYYKNKAIFSQQTQSIFKNDTQIAFEQSGQQYFFNPNPNAHPFTSGLLGSFINEQQSKKALVYHQDLERFFKNKKKQS